MDLQSFRPLHFMSPSEAVVPSNDGGPIPKTTSSLPKCLPILAIFTIRSQGVLASQECQKDIVNTRDIALLSVCKMY